MWNDLEAERATREAAADISVMAGEMAVEEWTSFEADGLTVPCLVVTPRQVRSDKVHVFVHGGGWVFGSPRQSLGITRKIAHHAGRRVVSVGYRLAPEHPYPAAILDTMLVLDALAGEDRLAGVLGSSAGAQIGLAAMMMQRDRGHPMPGAAVMINGAFAMSTESHAHRLHGNAAEGLTSAGMRAYIEAYGVAAAADPAYGDLTLSDMAGLSPLWFCCGDLDPLLDDTLMAYENVRATGGRPRLQIVPSRAHGFMNRWHGDATAEAALVTAIDWLETVVGDAV
jgi:acetyl esterase/lipase